ncbi:winged helix-turn-helix transcriptional regulator [Fulvivirga sediminis]|uniref:Helix-turn-helix transcriptional regulator n=1 Tax=Fulvivirga sediminis TaxID=2803949 RepID=A0A937JZC8_9BACT|nr:helix-turn-helix domain-containing protein [Fulvivirga sediminis]MBL3655150.1 helix-turn-helix transcriptional regulator [Fulvivirga sediminis]
MTRKKLAECNCSLADAMNSLGTKWKPIIICAIGKKTLRFGSIAALIHIISRKVLTEQLKELVADGILLREEHKEVPPRVEYSLSAKGLELLPIFKQLETWEQKYKKCD